MSQLGLIGQTEISQSKVLLNNKKIIFDSLNEKPTQQTPSFKLELEQSRTNKIYSADLKFDSRLFAIGIGITSIIVLFSILSILLIVYLKRKQRRHKSELNLYYTCEKQMPPDDECSIFKYSKGSTSATSTTASSSSSSGTTSAITMSIGSAFKKPKIDQNKKNDNDTTRIYSNMYELSDPNGRFHHNSQIEQQLLLQHHQNQHQQQVKFVPAQSAQEYQQINIIENGLTSPNRSTSFYLNQKPSFNSPFKPFVRNNQMNLNSDGSSNSSPSSSTTKNNSSCLTKSLMLSTSPSNIYYASPVHNKPSETYKIVSINNVSTLVKANLTDNEYNYNEILNYNQMLGQKKNAKTNYFSYSEEAGLSLDYDNEYKMYNEELAYEVADALGINKQPPKTQIVNPIQKEPIKIKNIDPNDLCVGQVNCNGAKLTLDCGITMLVPEGAIASEQHVTIYLGLCREESFKPKLNEKGTLLSEIVVIGGPANLTLLKPVVVSMEHNARNINTDWNVSLYSAFNSYNSSPDWNVIIYFFLGF